MKPKYYLYTHKADMENRAHINAVASFIIMFPRITDVSILNST